MTFSEYIIQERGKKFYFISLNIIIKCETTLEEYFIDLYSEYELLYLKKAKVIIEDDFENEMLSMVADNGKSLFYGNYWDFNRNGENFKSLFQKLDIEVDFKNVKLNE